MAYGVKYHFIKFNRLGIPTTVRLKLKDYTGVDTLLDLGGINFEFGQGRASSVIRGSAVKIGLWSLSQEQFSEFRDITDRKWQVEILQASSPYWCGWLTPEVFSEPFKQSVPYRIEITAVDGLGDLSNIDYTVMYDSATDSSRMSLLTIIFQCLGTTNLSLPINFSSTLRPAGSTGNPFGLVYYDNANFVGSSGDPMKCSEVLENLFPFGITIRQWRGAWYVIRTEDLTSPVFTYGYNSSGSYLWSTWKDLNETINDTSDLTFLNVPVSQSGLMSQEQAYKQAFANVDYGLKKSMLKNGNFSTVGGSWDDSEFTGLSGLEYQKYGDTYCGYIWPADAPGITRGVTQSILVESSSAAFVFSLNVAPCAELTIGYGPAYDSARFRVKLVGASATYYLDKLLGWVTTPTFIDITGLQSFTRFDNPIWSPVTITVSSIPVAGSLEIYLCATPYSGSSAILSFGVAYTEVLAYQIGSAYVASNKIKGVNNTDYNFIPAESTITLNDAPVTSNSRLMFKNFLSNSVGVPTTLWSCDTIAGSYPLAELYLRHLLSLHRKPTKIISMTMRGNIEWPGTMTDRHMNYYEVVSATLNNRESEWHVELREILSFADITPAITIVSESSTPAAESSSGSSITQTIIPTLPLVKVDFTASRTPTVLNYDTLYANAHGQYPVVRLFTIDALGNRLERSERPKYIISGGFIASIVYDLGVAETGFIILS